jgi:hypothetical protein
VPNSESRHKRVQEFCRAIEAETEEEADSATESELLPKQSPTDEPRAANAAEASSTEIARRDTLYKQWKSSITQ